MAQFLASAQSIKEAKRAPTTSRSTPGLKRIVVGGLAIRVPAEWESVSLEVPDHVMMMDPSGAVTFSCWYFDLGFEATAAEWGKRMARAPQDDETYLIAEEKLVVLPSGIRAYEVRYSRRENAETIAGIDYILIAHGTTLYTLASKRVGHGQANWPSSVRWPDPSGGPKVFDGRRWLAAAERTHVRRLLGGTTARAGLRIRSQWMPDGLILKGEGGSCPIRRTAALCARVRRWARGRVRRLHV